MEDKLQKQFLEKLLIKSMKNELSALQKVQHTANSSSTLKTKRSTTLIVPDEVRQNGLLHPPNMIVPIRRSRSADETGVTEVVSFSFCSDEEEDTLSQSSLSRERIQILHADSIELLVTDDAISTTSSTDTSVMFNGIGDYVQSVSPQTSPLRHMSPPRTDQKFGHLCKSVPDITLEEESAHLQVPMNYKSFEENFPYRDSSLRRVTTMVKEIVQTNRSTSDGSLKRKTLNGSIVTMEKAKKFRRRSVNNITSLIEESYKKFQVILQEAGPHWAEEYVNKYWFDVCNSGPISKAEGLRREKVWELFATEVKYFVTQLQPLRLVYKEFLVYLQKQSQSILPFVDINRLFGNIDKVCELSIKVAMDLLKLFKSRQPHMIASTEELVYTFRMFSSTFHPVYHTYGLNYERTKKYLDGMKENKAFLKYLEVCQAEPMVNRLKLNDLLISPLKHLMVYPLLLENIIKYTTAEPDKLLLQSSHKFFTLTLRELESRIAEYKTTMRLRELQEQTKWPTILERDPDMFVPQSIYFKVSEQPCGYQLAAKDRTLNHEGKLNLIGNKGQTLYKLLGVLCNDVFILLERKKQHSKPHYNAFRQPIRLEELEVYNIEEQGLMNCFTCLTTSPFRQLTALYTLQSTSQADKDIWLTKLKSAIAERQEKKQ